MKALNYILRVMIVLFVISAFALLIEGKLPDEEAELFVIAFSFVAVILFYLLVNSECERRALEKHNDELTDALLNKDKEL